MMDDCARMIQHACRIRPMRDGVRRSRWLVVAPTAPMVNYEVGRLAQMLLPCGSFHKYSRRAWVFRIGDTEMTVLGETVASCWPDKLHSLELTGGYLTQTCWHHPNATRVSQELLHRSNRYPCVLDFKGMSWAWMRQLAYWSYRKDTRLRRFIRSQMGLELWT